MSAPHVLVVTGNADDGLRYAIECPTQPPTATMPCATYGDECGCGERLSAAEVLEDPDAYDKLSEKMYETAWDEGSCPASPTGKHGPFDGGWYMPIAECWPTMMLSVEDEPARELGIDKPGRYPVRWSVGDDSEWMELELLPAAAEPADLLFAAEPSGIT